MIETDQSVGITDEELEDLLQWACALPMDELRELLGPTLH